ncbi:SIT4 phosphatase-associated protein-domain-containing protein, partial [Zopfochytrium polystomum]
MFWRFGYQSASAIDGLLEKETVTLEELLEVEELLQECKAHNSKLVDFLAKPENLSILLGLITNSDLDESKKYKYPYLACEVISCEIMSICDGLVADNELLANFWTFLDRQAPIDPLQASYFSKVNGILIQKKVPEMIAFVRNQPNIVERLLVHIANASIAELLLKIISVEELPEAQGIVGWLSEQGLIPQLIDGLNPTLDVEVHNTTSQTILDVIAVSYQNIAALEAAIAAGDTISTEGSTSLVDQLKSPEIMKKLVGFMLDMESPNASSTLANGINIIIELIRRYCSEIEQAEYQQHQYQQQMSSPRSGFVLPTDEKVHVLATDLNGLLSVLGERVEDMAVLLEKPRTTLTYAAVAGDVTRLGSERLKTCELFAEILHMQYLYYSSPLFDRMVEAASLPIASSSGSNPVDDLTESVSRLRLSSQQNVADELVAVTDKIVKSKILPMCLKLFFDLPWNNFIHSVVYDMIAKVFNTYSYTSTTSYARPPPFEDGDDNDPPAPVEKRNLHARIQDGRCLKPILVEGELSGKILEAQKRNDEEEKRPRGTRLGYMGHLTYIADEVCKLVEKCSPDFEGDDAPPLVHEDWDNYVNGVLRETKERDRQLLGGTRPSQP